VNRFTRTMSAAVIGLGLAGATGCGVDNDSEAAKLKGDLGSPPPASTKDSPKVTGPLPASREEAAKRSLELNTQTGKTYSGAKK
jgi:hypothetical protein